MINDSFSLFIVRKYIRIGIKIFRPGQDLTSYTGAGGYHAFIILSVYRPSVFGSEKVLVRFVLGPKRFGSESSQDFGSESSWVRVV